MVRLPPGWHLSAGGWNGMRSRPRPAHQRPRSVPGHQFSKRHSVPLRVTGQGVGALNGRGSVVVGPDGLGARWYVSQLQVATTTGPSDNSAVVIYAHAVLPGNVIAQTEQGGGDTMGVAVAALTPGDLLFAQWTGANTGDVLTLIVYGDQEVLL